MHGPFLPIARSRRMSPARSKPLPATSACYQSADVCVAEPRRLPRGVGCGARAEQGFRRRRRDDELPLNAVIEEVRTGLEATLRARALAHDPVLLQEVD